MTNTQYTEELMKRFGKPKFAKKLEKADAAGQVGNLRCGDVMRLELKVNDKTRKIEDIGFQTFGCAAAVASSDVVCELAKGKTIEEAKKLTKDDVIKKLGGMPAIKVHCSLLGIEALEKAIKDYEDKKEVNKK